MSLLFMDSFDHYTTSDILNKWSSMGGAGAITTVLSRNGGQSYRQNNANDLIQKILDENKTTLIYGAAYYQSVLTTGTFTGFLVSFIENSDYQICLYNDNAGNLRVYRGNSTGTLLGSTASQVINNASWFYLELKVLFSNTVGTVDVKVNGANVISLSGIDTSYSGNEYANIIRIGGPQVYYTYIDDLYICDGNGSTNNDFLGDCVVETIYPDGAGNSTEWTPVGAGSNYLCVDDATPDDDSTYVTSSGVSDLDLYTYDNITAGVAEVYGIQVVPYARKDSAGEVSLEHYVRVNSTDYVVGSGNIGDTYIYYPVPIEESPDTSTQWTVTEINALEVGINRSV